MSITWEKLVKVNKAIKPVDIKGKDYAQVNDRIKAFRELCPNGTITTDIIELANGVVTMKATVYDEEGKILGTGLAQEKESSSYINKTSYIENCETSAVGRALGFAGIGVDGSMCSAEELVNAITNQNKEPVKKQKAQNGDPLLAKIDAGQKAQIIAELERTGIDISAVITPFGIKTLDDMTVAGFLSTMNRFAKTKDKA
jgi:hypothetical protein